MLNRVSQLCLFVLLGAGAVSSVVAQPQAMPNAPRAASHGSSPTGQPSIFADIAAEAARQVPNSPAREAVGLPADLVRADFEDQAAYLVWQREFARESWRWHLFSTKLLLGAVLVIVGAGLYFTYLQFSREVHASLTEPTGKAGEAGSAVAGSDPVKPRVPAPSSGTTLKLTIEGFEMTSQVIGLLVLAFSLAFFYFYVKIVYPMQEVELQRQANTVEASGAAPAPGKGQP